jgi:hypothetical protein
LLVFTGCVPIAAVPLEACVIRYSSRRVQTALRSSVAHFVAPFLSRRPWGHFPTLDLVPSAVLTMGVQVCLAYMCFGSIGCMPRGLTPVSSGASLFPLKRNLGPASHMIIAVHAATKCVRGFCLAESWSTSVAVLKGPGMFSVHLYSLPWNGLERLR